jgi:hypothetical protein
MATLYNLFYIDDLYNGKDDDRANTLTEIGK